MDLNQNKAQQENQLIQVASWCFEVNGEEHSKSIYKKLINMGGLSIIIPM